MELKARDKTESKMRTLERNWRIRVKARGSSRPKHMALGAWVARTHPQAWMDWLVEPHYQLPAAVLTSLVLWCPPCDQITKTKEGERRPEVLRLWEAWHGNQRRKGRMIKWGAQEHVDLWIRLFTFAFHDTTKVEEITQSPSTLLVFFPLLSCPGSPLWHSHCPAQGIHLHTPPAWTQGEERGSVRAVLPQATELEWTPAFLLPTGGSTPPVGKVWARMSAVLHLDPSVVNQMHHRERIFQQLLGIVTDHSLFWWLDFTLAPFITIHWNQFQTQVL